MSTTYTYTCIVGHHSRFWNGNGNGYKNRNVNGNAEKNGYIIMTRNEEWERLDRNI